jgi:hypothetical protein
MKTNKTSNQLKFNVMKTNNFFKVLVSVVFFFATAAISMGQVENSDYVSSVVSGSGVTDTVSVGDSVGYYIQPDPYYHPNYTAGNGWSLTDNFEWNFSILPAATLNQMQSDTNYVTATFANTGNYTLTAYEKAPIAYGGCQSADTALSIVVIDSSSFAVHSGVGYIDTDIEECEGDPNLSNVVGIDITNNGGNNLNYNLQWSLTIFTLENDQTTKADYYNASKTAFGTPDTAIDYTAASPQVISNPGLHDLTHVAGNEFTVLDNKTTVYEYTVSAINDRYSRKGDYLSLYASAGAPGFATNADDFSYFSSDAFTITITVNPTPKTGPIFHIPNDWAN